MRSYLIVSKKTLFNNGIPSIYNSFNEFFTLSITYYNGFFGREINLNAFNALNPLQRFFSSHFAVVTSHAFNFKNNLAHFITSLNYSTSFYIESCERLFSGPHLQLFHLLPGVDLGFNHTFYPSNLSFYAIHPGYKFFDRFIVMGTHSFSFVLLHSLLGSDKPTMNEPVLLLYS